MRNLQAYLDSQNYDYTTDLEGDYHTMFFPVGYDLDIVNQAKRRGVKIIQRLDGAYYFFNTGWQYRKLNKIPQTIYTDYADVVVFQSDYSRKQITRLFGGSCAANTKVIINGVNTDIFYPNKAKQSAGNLRVAVTGNFRRDVMLAPIIKSLDYLASKRNTHFQLDVVGPINKDTLRKWLDRPFVNYRGALSMQDTADALREADAFVHSERNGACPNAVIEAIATGLPVVSFDSGAVKELSWFNADLIAPMPKRIFHLDMELSWHKLVPCFENLVANYAAYRQESLLHVNAYAFESCGRAYQEIFESINISNER